MREYFCTKFCSFV